MPRCTHGMGLGHTAPLPFPMENACLLSTDCFAFIQTNFLAGLQESQGTPSLCRAGGKDLSWFLLIGLIYSAVQM